MENELKLICKKDVFNEITEEVELTKGKEYIKLSATFCSMCKVQNNLGFQKFYNVKYFK